MRAVVVYESMYGNTHEIATAIGDGLRDGFDDVRVVPVGGADEGVDGCDLVVVGGPTHAHGMSRESTRHQAVEDARTSDDLEVDPDAEGPGLRDWLATAPATGRFAAFDTRVDIAAILSGRASKGISRKLRHHGLEEVVDPESFLVTTDNELEPAEIERALDWGRQIARRLAPVS